MKKQYYLFFTILAFCYSCKNENPSVTTFYPDGSKREVYKTKKDKIEGEYLQYYNTGELMAKKNFVNGKEDGKAVTYYETGELKEVQFYLNGKVNGNDTVFYKSGKKRYTSQYSDNLKNGVFQRWSESDSLEFETIYKMDSIVSITDFVKKVSTQ